MILRAMTIEMIMISIMISLAIITDLTSVLLLKVFASTTEFTAYTMNNHSYQTIDFTAKNYILKIYHLQIVTKNEENMFLGSQVLY